MNHKTTMPEPVAKVHVGNPVRYEHIDAWCLDVGTHYLITTDQAEAYANARVRASLQSQAHPNRQGRIMDKLFCDLKTDEEKATFFLSGRGYETGVISQAIQNDVAMAYHRCVEYKKELEALQTQDREGWKEAAIAWEVCASLHREHCKGKDPFYKTRQVDFVKHAEASREKALSPCSAEDKTDAERYRWLRNSAGFLALPYVDHGAGPEFPSGSELDEAIDHARRIEDKT